ncbi:MAG: hypothetical protein JWN52_1235 [Actinomycetia bacterium]|jgi:hypothetical protein|nr:hypothetical protein [Actinomycetes bacterium]
MATAEQYEKALKKLEMDVKLSTQDMDLIKVMLKESGSRGNRARNAMK